MNQAVIDVWVPRKNSEGYADPTMYQALKQVQKSEYGYRPLVYICSPYAGDTEANVAVAREFCALAVARRVIPLAPHLLFPQFMDDTNPDQRELAMFFNRVLLSKCEQVWVYTPQVSAGMRVEIGWAQQMDIPVRFFDQAFEEVYA